MVASKQDKVKPSKRGVRRREVAEGCGVGIDDVVWVSAAKGDGIEKLRGHIHNWLAEGLARNPSSLAETAPLPATPAAVIEPGPDGTYDDEDEWN